MTIINLDMKHFLLKNIKIITILFLLINFIGNRVNYISIQTNIDINKFNELCTDIIAQYETKYNEYNLNRSENIKLAVNKVNGTIIMPNEIFSFNEVVGQRSEENGFKLATVYQNGKVIEGFGGGVCQVSSTLYNAVLCANLQVIERKGHLFSPSYIYVGGDATVADGYVDFKFKNTRKYPIKITCSVNNGTLCVKLYGKKQKEECNIEIKSKNVETLQYKIVYETDEDMKVGESKIVQKRKRWL